MLPNPALIIQYQTLHLQVFTARVEAQSSVAPTTAIAVKQGSPDRPAFLHADVIGWGLYGIVALILTVLLAAPLFTDRSSRIR